MINPFDNGYYNSKELKSMGFKKIGDNVKIAKNCTIIGLENISIGNNVRIDGFTTITAYGGELVLGNYIHIGGYCFLGAGAGIYMEDFSGLSQGVKVYSKSDDYSGRFMTNPTVPPKYTNVKCGKVIIKKHVIIGSSSVILPGVTIGKYSAVGALSLVNKDLPELSICVGQPAKRIADRHTGMLELEQLLEQNINN
jgi:galactoside O-acetyltransferase